LAFAYGKEDEEVEMSLGYEDHFLKAHAMALN
jgi:hypothetical protein